MCAVVFGPGILYDGIMNTVNALHFYRAGLVLLALLCSLPVRAEGPLRLSTFPEPGITIVFRRVLTEAYEQLGREIDITEYPAERALILASSGAVDGEAGRISIIEKSYPNLVRVPTPIYRSEFTAFTRRADIDVSQGWAALKPYRVGVLIGFKYIEARAPKLNSVSLPSYEKLMSMLAAGRLDVVIMPLHDGLAVIRDKDLWGIHALEPPLSVEPMYHYLHPSNAELVESIDAILQRMQAQGRIRQIADEVRAELSTR